MIRTNTEAFIFYFSVQLLSVLSGHSVFSSPPQRPMTSRATSLIMKLGHGDLLVMEFIDLLHVAKYDFVFVLDPSGHKVVWILHLVQVTLETKHNYINGYTTNKGHSSACYWMLLPVLIFWFKCFIDWLRIKSLRFKIALLT